MWFYVQMAQPLLTDGQYGSAICLSVTSFIVGHC